MDTLGTYAPDNLLAGHQKSVVSEAAVLAAGEDRARGTILGQITKGAITVEADAGNTGDGVASGAALGKNAMVGTYTLECTAAATNAGTFAVYTPDGEQLEDLTVGVAYSNNHIALSIADGDADFVVGDKFTLTVAAGSGQFKAAQSDAVDGSQDAVAILARDVDATSEYKACVIYREGEFNEDRVVAVKEGDTAATFKEELRAVGILLRDPVSNGQ